MNILFFLFGVLLSMVALGSLYLFMWFLGIRPKMRNRKRVFIAMAVFVIFLFIFAASSSADVPIVNDPIPGDVDSDGHVNATDFSLLAAAYLSYPAEMRVNPAINARWDPRADFNNDLIVNCLDFSILAMNYGE